MLHTSTKTLSSTRPLLFAGALALGLLACGDAKKDTAASGEPASSGSAKPTAQAPPAVADPAIASELKKVAGCKREEGFRERDCAAHEAWTTYADKFIEEDDLQLTKQKKLAGTCVTSLDDKDDSIREAAHDCVSSYRDGVADPKSVLVATLDRLVKEASPGVKSSMFDVLGGLDLTKHGLAPKIVELARPMVGKDSSRGDLASLVGALVPSGKNEPAPEAVAFAIELLEKGEAQGRAVDVLAKTKAKSKEACEALTKLVETKKHPWGDGLRGMQGIDGHCKEQAGRIADVIVAKAGEADGYDKGFVGGYVIYFQWLADKKIFDDAQKAKLRAAIEPLIKTAKQDHQKESYQKVLDALK
jgi:hypothetical protein